MNSKTMFKRILPIVIALLAIILIAVISTVATGAKDNPNLGSNLAKEDYIVYTAADGTQIKVSNKKVWKTLKGSVTAATTTVSEFVDEIDAFLLADYLDKLTVKEVSDKVAEYLFGSTFDEYLKKNKDAFELEAKKNGSNDWEVEARKAIDEILDSKLKELKFSYGINAEKSIFTYTENGVFIETDEKDEDGNNVYAFTVKEDSELYKYYMIPVARSKYAYDELVKEYEEELEAYQEYLTKKEAYDQYVKDLEDYKEDYKDWENTKWDSKAEKEANKPTKPSEVKKPKEVDEPVLVEEDFETLFLEEMNNSYWAVLVPYASNQAAVDALYQLGIVVAKNYDGDYVWFHAANLSKASPAAKAEYKEKEYTVMGDSEEYESGLITDNAFYERLVSEEYYNEQNKPLTSWIIYDGANPSELACGAYPLSEKEIKEAIIKLYNQFYQAHEDEKLVSGVDYNVSATDVVFEKTDLIKYTEAELTELGLFSTSTSNKFNKYDPEDEFDQFYSNRVVSAGNANYIYFIVAKEVITDWEDTVKEAGEDYTKTAFYAEHKEELLKEAVTAAYTNEVVAELRYDNGLKIYDQDLESVYMDTYKSDYKAIKATSKSVIAKVKGLEIKIDDLFSDLVSKYGVLTALESYQYDWMFLEANYGKDEDGEVIYANKYVDYAKYKKNNDLEKAIYNNSEAKELYKNVKAFVKNTKSNFTAGAYESQGYPADYGWQNFMEDYFLESYGIEVNNTDDLALFYIYQQIVTEYAEYVAKLNEDKWNAIFELYMAQQLSSYLNCKGVHLLIQVKDLEGNMVDPSDWTDAQNKAAEKLYDQINAVVQVVSKDKVGTVLTEIVSAFDAAPLLLDGARPNDSYNIYGGEYEGSNVYYPQNVLNYVYEYYVPGFQNPITVDLSAAKSAGLSIITESLTVTEGAMVDEFEAAVRQLWNKEVGDLLKGETVDKKVVYPHEITTQFGKHLYVNLSMSMTDYVTTDENKDPMLVQFPSYDHAVMYIYETNESDEDDYESFEDLLEDLVDAEEDENETKIASVKEEITELFKELGLTYANFDELREVLEAYADKDNAAQTKKQLNTWFGTASASNGTSSFTGAYGDLTGSSYYQSQVLAAILASIDNIEMDDKNALVDYLEYYIDNYYGSLASLNAFVEYANTGKMDQDDLEEILELVDALTFGGDVVNTYAEKATSLTDLFKTAKEASKAYSKDDFSASAQRGWDYLASYTFE